MFLNSSSLMEQLNHYFQFTVINSNCFFLFLKQNFIIHYWKIVTIKVSVQFKVFTKVLFKKFQPFKKEKKKRNKKRDFSTRKKCQLITFVRMLYGTIFYVLVIWLDISPYNHILNEINRKKYCQNHSHACIEGKWMLVQMCVMQSKKMAWKSILKRNLFLFV